VYVFHIFLSLSTLMKSKHIYIYIEREREREREEVKNKRWVGVIYTKGGRAGGGSERQVNWII
jgi:hypothetical protein